MQALDQRDSSRAEAASVQFDAELWRFSNHLKDEERAIAEEKRKDKQKVADAAPPMLKLMPDAFPDPLVSNLSVMSLELRAGVLMTKKLTDDAKKLYAQAAREEKALGYHEPPVYIRPVGETEAAALLAASDWSDAKAAYQDALVERPRQGFHFTVSPSLANSRATPLQPRLNTRTFWLHGSPPIPTSANLSRPLVPLLV